LSSGVVRYLFWLGKPAIVKDDEIKTIKNWLEGSNSEDISVEPYRTGTKIKVVSGPFANQEAVIQEVNKKEYVLFLESLGCVLKMNIKGIYNSIQSI